MTATLPTSRKDNLENIGLRVYPNKEEQAELKDLEKAETHPRYDLEIVASEDEAMKIAVEEFGKGKRVLWVVNTVKRCQNVAKNFEKKTQTRPLVYHSRFRLCDRKNRHEDTVNSLQANFASENCHYNSSLRNEFGFGRGCFDNRNRANSLACAAIRTLKQTSGKRRRFPLAPCRIYA